MVLKKGLVIALLFRTTLQFKPMKNLNLLLPLLIMITMSGCAVIGGIFKAGAVVGILAVLVVIGIIVWIFSLFSK
jgi:hypothetical protein